MDFLLACAIEADSQKSEQLQKHGICITFDGVEGLNAGQSGEPIQVLAVDVVQIDDVKRIIVNILFLSTKNKKI